MTAYLMSRSVGRGTREIAPSWMIDRSICARAAACAAFEELVSGYSDEVYFGGPGAGFEDKKCSFGDASPQVIGGRLPGGL